MKINQLVALPQSMHVQDFRTIHSRLTTQHYIRRVAGGFDMNPASTKRNEHVIITSKQRFDVIITFSLRCMFAGKSSYPPIRRTHEI